MDLETVSWGQAPPWPFPTVWPFTSHCPLGPQPPGAGKGRTGHLRGPFQLKWLMLLRFPKLPTVPMLCNDLHHSPCHSHRFLNPVPASWVYAFPGSGQFPLCVSVQSGWIRDLPKLTSLYLRKMPRLNSLEGDIFKVTPDLQQLDCQDSPALTSVHTHIFQDTPLLQVLHFQK